MHVMTAAVSAQDEVQMGLAAAEPQLCMNLRLARNSLLVVVPWAGTPVVPFNLRSYQTDIKPPVANDHGARSGQMYSFNCVRRPSTEPTT